MCTLTMEDYTAPLPTQSLKERHAKLERDLDTQVAALHDLLDDLRALNRDSLQVQNEGGRA